MPTGSSPSRPVHRRRILSVETLEPRYVLSANVLITEFMASNSTTLLDGDGESSDWIELYNPSAEMVDLAGWHLTDDDEDLTKWTFPSNSPRMILDPGEYLVVFASGQLANDYVDADGNLHTNFALSADGESLVLSDATGAIVDQFAEYPPQRNDVSYGINQNANTLTLVGPNSPMTALLPTDGALDAPGADVAPAWSLSTFDDTSWLTANGPAVGYDFGSPPPPDVPNGTLLPEGLIGADFTDPEEDGIPNGTIFAGGFPGSPSGEEPDKGLDNSTSTKWLAFEPTGTYYGFHFANGEQRVVTAYTITSANDVPNRDPYSWTLSGSNDGTNFTVIDTRTAQDFASRFETRLYEFSSMTPYEYYRFDLQTEYGATGHNQPNSIQVAEFELLSTAPLDYTPLLDLDIASQWSSTQTSVYQRVSFDVSDPASLAALQLGIQYDDGFVAYLNGQRVASAAAPALPNYQSHATEVRDEDLAIQPQLFNLTPYLGSLVPGTNVLAIHALNVSDSSSDLLSIPTLTATQLIDETVTTVFMPEPTPGGPNTAGVAGIVTTPALSVEHGFYSAPFQLTITNDTPGATVYYTTDGTAPSPLNGTVYSNAVAVSGTTTIRAQAFHDDYLSSLPVTSTYLFVDDIVQQTYQDTLNKGFPTSWGPYGADYGLDPDVIGHFNSSGVSTGGDGFGGVYAASIKSDLQAIPTMSLVMDLDELFGPTGIYTNATASGAAWERPVSVEYIDPATGQDFQIDAGIRMHGGAFRNDSLSKKHSMRLVFKGIYEGNTKLDFPLFGEDAATSFDTVVLRMESNDGYAWDAAGTHAQYARDVFAHEAQLAMGQPSSHHTRVHLYINGVYWGLYTPVERPDDSFAATYFGGDKNDWDAINSGSVNSGSLDAWNTLVSLSQAVASASTESAKTAAYMKVLGLNPDGSKDPTYQTYLDATNYIDYMLLNFYTSNVDWPHRNWWAVRERGPDSTGFKFVMWDTETALGLAGSSLYTDSTGVSDGVAAPYARLKTSKEFRVAFSDRVHKAFFNNGPLATGNSLARYQAMVDEITDAIVAESARWGDMHGSIPYTKAEWLNEIGNVLNFLQSRNAIFLNQLRAAGLYPNVTAPVFSQFGGLVAPGYDLTIAAPAGTIYFTTDGSDPRAIGGGLSPTAQTYHGAVDIPAGMTVKARVRSGGMWSALNEAEFTTAVPADATNLRIVEFHYNPAPQVDVADEQSLEFIELLNPSGQTVSLDGVQITQFASTPYKFPSGITLVAGERMVVTKDPATFAAVYGSGINVAPGGYGTANLSNGGERVVLLDALGQAIQDFTYEDEPPWPASADGDGPSVEIIDPLGNPSDPANWRASYYRGGSPGTSGEGPSIAGDFDGDHDVDGRDFLEWQRGFGTQQLKASATDGDADADRDVDGDDLTPWSENFGLSAMAYSAPIQASSAEAWEERMAVSSLAAFALLQKQEETVVDELLTDDAIGEQLPDSPSPVEVLALHDKIATPMQRPEYKPLHRDLSRRDAIDRALDRLADRQWRIGFHRSINFCVPSFSSQRMPALT